MDRILLYICLTAVLPWCSRASKHQTNKLATPEVVVEWEKLRFLWPNTNTSEHFQQKGLYKPKNSMIADLALYEDILYLSIPRYRSGVPFTLVSTHLDGSEESPRLKPFPMNYKSESGPCHDLRNVNGIELDSDGRLWVLDAGVIHTFNRKIDWRCPAKLVIYDLKKLGRPEVFRYEFPDYVALRHRSVLVDMALHKVGKQPNDWVAYITDSKGYAIVVFSLKSETSFRVEHESMQPEKRKGYIKIKDAVYDFDDEGVYGVAFDKRTDTLYYSPLASYKLYSINASIIRERDRESRKHYKQLDDFVRITGTKPSQSAGMTTDFEGRLYFGLLGENAVSIWSPASHLTPKSVQIAAKDNADQFVKSFSIHNCWLYFTSNRIHELYSGDESTVEEVTNRVLRLYIGTESYLGSIGSKHCPQVTHTNSHNHTKHIHKHTDEDASEKVTSSEDASEKVTSGEDTSMKMTSDEDVSEKMTSDEDEE